MGLFSWFDRFRSPEYHQDAGGNHWTLLNGGVDDLPFEDLKKVYLAIPHLRAVIDKKAELFANGIAQVVDIDNDGNETVNTDHEANKVLEQPNYLQNMKGLMFMTMVYKCITGDAFIKPVYKVGYDVRNLSKLWVIAYNDFKIHTHKENILLTQEAKQFIKAYEFWTDPQQHFKITDPKDLIHFRDYGTSYSEGTSKISSLREPIQNIHKALVARGILASRQGGIGILSKDARSNELAIPMMDQDKKDLRTEVNKYGYGREKGAIIVTDQPLKYQSMVFSARDLMLHEEVKDSFMSICDAYGIDQETFNSDSKYSSKDIADKNNYQNTIIPEWQDFADGLTNSLGLLKEKKRIRIDYSHIQVLQTDKKNEEETKKMKSERLLQELDRNIITLDDYKQYMYGS